MIMCNWQVVTPVPHPLPERFVFYGSFFILVLGTCALVKISIRTTLNAKIKRNHTYKLLDKSNDKNYGWRDRPLPVTLFGAGAGNH